MFFLCASLFDISSGILFPRGKIQMVISLLELQREKNNNTLDLQPSGSCEYLWSRQNVLLFPKGTEWIRISSISTFKRGFNFLASDLHLLFFSFCSLNYLKGFLDFHLSVSYGAHSLDQMKLYIVICRSNHQIAEVNYRSPWKIAGPLNNESLPSSQKLKQLINLCIQTEVRGECHLSMNIHGQRNTCC